MAITKKAVKKVVKKAKKVVSTAKSKLSSKKMPSNGECCGHCN